MVSEVAGGARRPGRPRAGLHDVPGRWATSMRFLLRSLNLRGPVFLLAFLAVTVGATVTATVLNLKAGLQDRMSRELRAYGPNLLIVPAGTAPGAAGGETPTLDEAALGAVRGLLSSTPTAPILLAGGTVEDRPATIVGADLEDLRRLYPSWTIRPAAGTPVGGAGQPACLLGVSLARRAGAVPGGAVEVRAGARGAALAVSGVVETGEAEDEQAFVPLALLQEITGQAGHVSLVALTVDGGPEAVDRVGAAIESAVPRARARPLRAIALAQGAILGRLDRMMVLLTLVVLVLSGLCLVTTLMSMVVERESEIGLARAIGGGDGEIFRMFLGEVGLLGILGAVAGLIVGAGLTRLVGARLFGAAIEPRAGVIPAVLGASIAICLIAVYLPLRRALSVQPAAALRGD